MSKSDDFFPLKLEPDEEGRVCGRDAADLGRAIETWFYAQNRLEVTVGEAAVAFNVSPEKVAQAVVAYDSMYFWIATETIPLEKRRFDCDGE